MAPSSETPFGRPLRGLVNPGHQCGYHSALQFLRAFPELLRALRARSVDGHAVGARLWSDALRETDGPLGLPAHMDREDATWYTDAFLRFANAGKQEIVSSVSTAWLLEHPTEKETFESQFRGKRIVWDDIENMAAAWSIREYGQKTWMWWESRGYDLRALLLHDGVYHFVTALCDRGGQWWWCNDDHIELLPQGKLDLLRQPGRVVLAGYVLRR